MTTESKAAFTISHPPVSDQRFRGAEKAVSRTFESASGLLAYFDDMCAPALARRQIAEYRSLLEEAGVEPEQIINTRGGDLATLLSDETAGKVVQALRPREGSRAATRVGPLWESSFHDHLRYKGPRFSLSAGSGINFIADLNSTEWGNWSDRIASVNTGLFIPVTVLGRDPYFFGGIHVLVVDQPNLGDWNDQASAVAVGTVPPQVILTALSSIFGIPL